MLYVNETVVPGLEKATFTFFGTTAVEGTAEVARFNGNLAEERFLNGGDIIPIIGEERYVRNISFAPRTGPDMFDYVRMIQPPGLITFGVGAEEAAKKKVQGTHMDIVLREWGIGNGPCVPFLGVAIERVYDDSRVRALEYLTEEIGSRQITMARSGEDINISV